LCALLRCRRRIDFAHHAAASDHHLVGAVQVIPRFKLALTSRPRLHRHRAYGHDHGIEAIGTNWLNHRDTENTEQRGRAHTFSREAAEGYDRPAGVVHSVTSV